MKYILEITKIIDGAIRADRDKVAAYTEQMARKLQDAGEGPAAKRILSCLKPHRAPDLAANDFTTTARPPVDSESRLRLADEVVPSDPPPFVALSSEGESLVEKFVRHVGAADRLIAEGVGISPSMLLYGSPGCGKTMLAKNIASRLDLPMLVARSDSLISSYLGSTAKNIRLLFEHASSTPSVLFLDEFDAFAKLRDDHHELGELKRVVVSLLQNIDALDGRTVLLAASNHEHLLDPAVWRRFSYKLNLTLPDAGQRGQLFRHFLGRYASDDVVSLLAAASESLNGSQIRDISEDSIREAVLSGLEVADSSMSLLHVARLRLGDGAGSNGLEQGASFAKHLHELDSQTFNGKRLADIFRKSPGTISRWLRG